MLYSHSLKVKEKKNKNKGVVGCSNYTFLSSTFLVLWRYLTAKIHHTKGYMLSSRVSLSNQNQSLLYVQSQSLLCAFKILVLRQFCTLMFSVLQMYRSHRVDRCHYSTEILVFRPKSVISLHTFIVSDGDKNVQATKWTVPVWINGKWSPSCLQVRPLSY